MTPREGMVAAACRKFCRWQAQEPDQLKLSCSSATFCTVPRYKWRRYILRGKAQVTAAIQLRQGLASQAGGKSAKTERQPN